VVEVWEACRASYEDYVGWVSVFDQLDADHWARWHALRLALPGVRHAVLRSLLAALDGVPTPDLVATCTAARPSGAVA
jgi:hypothetical protein